MNTKNNNAGEDATKLAEQYFHKQLWDYKGFHTTFGEIRKEAFIAGYKAALQNKVPVECYGLRWVKASDVPLPKNFKELFVRYATESGLMSFDSNGIAFIRFTPAGKISGNKIDINKLEWLEEPNTTIK